RNERRLVDAERVAYRVPGRGTGGAVAGAEIAVTGEPNSEKVAIAVERQFGQHLRVAAMRVGDKAAGALVGPFDRPAEFARGVHQAIMLGIGCLLHAERAADPVGQYPQLVAPDAEHAGDVVAEAEHALA